MAPGTLLKRLLPLCLLAACATSRVRPDVHEDGWLLVETAHISLRTDLDRDDAIQRARKLEQYWGALAHLYDLVAPGAPPPQRPFGVIHLASCNDFDRISWGNNAGFMAPMDGEDVAVTCEGRHGDVLIHELAHIFNHHYVARLPRWVDEGLATYYSTLQVRDGRAVLGNFPSHLSHYWNRSRWLPNLTALRRMSADEFYNSDRSGPNYFCAWKLVHLLNNTDPDRQRRFRRYLAALRSGTGAEAGWQQAFGDLPAQPLEDDYANYQRRDRVNRLTTSYDWKEPPPPRVRRLRPGEAHVLWANLLSVAHEDAVAEQLEGARAADPNWPELLYWRARLLRPPDEVKLLRAYVARRPDDGKGWRGLVRARLRRAAPSDDPFTVSQPGALAAMQGDVRQLIEHASDPISLNLIGWYYALRRNPNAGLNFAIRAVQTEPSCADCWDTVGVLYFQAGRIDLAIDAQERAVSIYAEGAPKEVTVRLRRYREAARRAGRAGSGR